MYGPFALANYKDPIVAVQDNLSKIGIQAELDYPNGGAWMQYMGPGGWEKGTMICNPIPMMDASSLGGVQMMFSMIGQSWLRTPEMTKAYEAVLAAPSIDINKIRAVTDIITRDALLIPICESGSGRADRPYVVAGIAERASMSFYNSEDFWMNK